MGDKGQIASQDAWLIRFGIAAFALVGILAQPRKGVLNATASAPATPAARSALAAATPGGAKAVDHKPGLLGIGRAVVDRISRNNITMVGAGIAFYVLGALFPALAAMVSIYGLFADPHQVITQVNGLGDMLPPEALKIITDGITGFAQKSGSQLSFALLISVILALWSARAGMSAVMTGLNIAYEEAEKRSFIVQTMVALALTLGGMAFAIIAILAVGIIPAILAFLHADGLIARVLDIARWPVLAVIVVVGFAVIYRYAPSRSHPDWKWITWGSGIAALLWMVGSVIFSYYVSHFGSYDATYGALGSVVVLLLWFWVSATVLLIGAEIDAEVDARATKTGSPTAAWAAVLRRAASVRPPWARRMPSSAGRHSAPVRPMMPRPARRAPCRPRRIRDRSRPSKPTRPNPARCR